MDDFGCQTCCTQLLPSQVPRFVLTHHLMRGHSCSNDPSPSSLCPFFSCTSSHALPACSLPQLCCCCCCSSHSPAEGSCRQHCEIANIQSPGSYYAALEPPPALVGPTAPGCSFSALQTVWLGEAGTGEMCEWKL